MLLGLLLAAFAFAEYAPVNGMKMYYEVHGHGPPIVLLHGGMNTIQTSFARQIPVLAQNHRVIAIEQMAHGHTADVPGRELSYEQMAEDTAILLKQLGVTAADVIGWSDGGQIALRLAFRHPKLVRRVVASGVGFGPDAAMVKTFSDPKWFNTFVNDAYPESRAEFARVSPDGPGHWRAYAEKARRMWLRPTWGFTPAEAATIRLPVMVIAGDQETVEESVRVFRAIPKARLYIVPGTGHATFQSRPEWMHAAILDFLSGN